MSEALEEITVEKEDFKEKFLDFLKKFKTPTNEYKYRSKVREMCLEGEISLYIDFNDLIEYNGELAAKLVDSPEKYLESASQALAELVQIENPRYFSRVKRFYIRIVNPPEDIVIPLRKLKAQYIGKLVAVEGIVTRISPVKYLLKEAVFRDKTTGVVVRVPQGKGFVQPQEGSIGISEVKGIGIKKREYELIPEESDFIEWQKVVIQEKPEELPPGQIPRSIEAVLVEDLVDVIRPGDRVKIVGILKVRQERTLRKDRPPLFHAYIDVNSIEIEGKEFSEIELTQDDIKEILELSKREDIRDLIVKSIAPSIYGYDIIKKGIATLLFGGEPKVFPDGVRVRGDINILLVGDPGTAKSQLLRYVATLAPRAIYTTGKGSTAAGLCVAPGTLIALDSVILPIETIVEEKIKEGCIQIRSGVLATKNASPVNIQTINPLNISTRLTNEFWKLKSPEKLIKVVTRTGREIILTPETKMMTIENGAIVWKEARDFAPGDNIAVVRKLEHKGRKIFTLELIEDQHDIVVYGAKTFVKKILEKLKSKYNLTTRELARKLGINENKLYYNWTNQNTKDNIHLQELIRLAKIAGYTYDEISDHIDFFSQKMEDKIKLPKYINQDFMYFVGLVAGGGSISKTNYGGYSIRFSNTSTELRDRFKKLVQDLFGVSVEEGIDKHGTPYLRFHSKIIAHILKKLGIPESPEAHKIDMSEIMLLLPNNELMAFISGLFDCDASVIERETGSSTIEFVTASEKLAKKLQLVLLRFGIISFLRKRNSAGKVEEFTDKNGHKRIIRTVHDEYVLTIYGENMKKFRDLIGFKYSAKEEKLKKVLSKGVKIDTNIDVIPEIDQALEIINKFYDLKLKKKYNESSISRRKLQEIVAYLKNAEIKKVKISLSHEIKEKIANALSSYALEYLTKDLGIDKNQLYDYFKRRDRDIEVPLDILEKLTTLLHKKNTKLANELNLKINQARIQMEYVKRIIQYLDKLANSDIFWDKIKKLEILDSRDIPYVYDLTVRGTHNFIANGIIVHNTAAVVRDKTTGEFYLEAGALVLADGGVACIDEFDKMDPRDRVSIHEAMEQQTVSIAKAGIVARLNARAAILAAANPAYGRYLSNRTIAENIDLPVTILSRFDLIFVITDIPEEERDSKLAQHLVRMHSKVSKQVYPEYIPLDTLKKYIAYARKYVHPRLSPEAEEKLVKFYVEMRKRGEDPNAPVTITPRQLEALIRLAEAHAKMGLCDTVTSKDVEAAIELMMYYLKSVGMDMETKRIDIDIVMTGKPKSQREKFIRLMELIKKLEEENKGKPIKVDTLYERAEEEGLDRVFVEKALDHLKREGEIYEPRSGYIKKT